MQLCRVSRGWNFPLFWIVRASFYDGNFLNSLNDLISFTMIETGSFNHHDMLCSDDGNHDARNRFYIYINVMISKNPGHSM